MRDPDSESPYHEGERSIQSELGVRQRAEQMGRRMIRDAMPDQHRALFEELPFVIVGSLDARGRPWASLLHGPPGFVHSPDPQTLTIAARASLHDPLAAALAPGVAVGLLGIQLETRRRNRVNGRVTKCDAAGCAITVEQSFGNCPKYISARTPTFVARQASTPVREAAALSERAVQLVTGCDTGFIASAFSAQPSFDAREGLDVSHRGGKPGFVSISQQAECSVLTMPDFAGNNAFNTLGNLVGYPRAGMLFLDFDSGDLLQLTGRTEIVWNGPEVERFHGAERLLRFHVEEGSLWGAALPFRWSAAEPSPFVLKTGMTQTTSGDDESAT